MILDSTPMVASIMLLEVYIVINFMIREISRDTHKLAKTPKLIKKKSEVISRIMI